jgi:hypothetical protein
MVKNSSPSPLRGGALLGDASKRGGTRSMAFLAERQQNKRAAEATLKVFLECLFVFKKSEELK